MTPLAVVLNELLQNTVDHAFPGHVSFAEGHFGLVEIFLDRTENQIRMAVRDNGVGVPDDFDSDSQQGLGFSIIRGLATTELGGNIEVRRRSDATGSEALVEVPFPGDSSPAKVN